MPTKTVDTTGTIQDLRDRVRDQAQLAREELNNLDPGGIEALYQIRFENIGYDYLRLKDDRLDFSEQVNQTFHCLVQLAVAEKLLMKSVPACGGLSLNLGEKNGWDIECICSSRDAIGEICEGVVAEVFATKGSRIKRKLADDVAKLIKSKAADRFVFFFDPRESAGRRRDLEPKDGTVEVWALEREELMRQCHPVQAG